ncbi:hypothetical protein Daesc_006614 [Daldinia eschscholtzii]|uniref:Fe2OG dioxygenase domain-containing protein n=1 Tax=Daldinia eschscholtzii TaxID=292717 RepID=A0AAX6MHK0_9PEZI
MAGSLDNTIAQAIPLITDDTNLGDPITEPNQGPVVDHTPVVDTIPAPNPISVADTPNIAHGGMVKYPAKRKYKEIEEEEHAPSVSQMPGSQQVRPRRVTRSRAKLVETVADAHASPADVHANKPEPYGQPVAWADKRAALNDALPYFKAHQGSVHTKDLVPKGMLIDCIVGIRDYFSSQVIVTSIGGGRVQDPITKTMVRTEDQGEDGKNFKALKYALENKHPFVMIADIWQEKIKGDKEQPVVVYMIRLEKVRLDTKSWWTPKGVSAHEAGEFGIGTYSCASHTCTTCQSQSKEIFEQGWTCLNSECSKYFELAACFDIDHLTYSDAFLRERTAYTGPEFDDERVPSLPSEDNNSIGSEKEYKQGILCPKCHCCSRRIKWDGWCCENAECDFKHIVPLKQTPLDGMRSENQKMEQRRSSSANDVHESIIVHETIAGGQEFKTFFLPDEDGKTAIGTITRIRPTEAALSRRGGIDDLYLQLQREDLKLERRPAKNAGCRVEELTSHFSGNFGAPYKFGVVVKTTTSFGDAPAPILETLLRLTWGGKAAVETSVNLIQDKGIKVLENAIPSEFEQYNEQLVLGYFENSKISAHDDGEKELGPNVASLSLGSPSVMKFSPKKGKNIGDTKDINKKKRKPVLSLLLKHGDMLVMHGERIQKLYLHAVDPCGKHRFALTCRHVRPRTIPDEEQRELSIVNGKIPNRWAAVRYDGREDRFESSVTGEVATSVGAIIGSG